MTTMPVSRSFDAIAVGERLPELRIEATLTSLVMYAAATWDFHRYHYDTRYVSERGFPAPFVDGQMLGALIARQVMQWGGRDAFLRRLAYRLGAMVFVDDEIILTGEVVRTQIDSGHGVAVCRVDIVKPDGTTVVSAAEATLDFGPVAA